MLSQSANAAPGVAVTQSFDYDSRGNLLSRTDCNGNVVKSRMAPGEIVQQPALDGVPNPPGSLASGDPTIDWDGDGVAERYDGYPITLAVGDQLLLTASSAAFDPVLLLQRPGQGLATALFDDHSGGGTTARLLVTADTAGTWTVVVTARDENATGGYALQIVKDQHAIVPTALVEYDFTYDKAGNLVSATEDQAAVAQFGALGPAANGLGVQTSYTVNALNRVTRYRHIAAGLVTKRTDFAYRADGSVGTVTRFAGAGVNPIGTSTAAYDAMGRLTGITHAPTASPAISYGYAYDAASRITSLTTPEGTSTFTLDATDQLLSASLTGEAYAYDNTGNRTSAGTQTSTGNRLAFDGTYRYAYDAEGNRTAKFRDTNAGGALSLGDTDVTLYAYDQRNRLVAVSHVNAWTSTQAAGLPGFTASGTALPGSDLELRYTYDYADRRIRRAIDADGQGGAFAESVSFAAYAGDVRTLEIARPNDKIVIDSVRGPIGFLGQVVQRNFYGNGVDEILAVDQVSWNGTTPTTSTFWTFTDHQDSVRDIVSGNAADRGAVVEHRQYDSFGRIVRRTTGPQAGAPVTPGVMVDFGYAGRPLEARTGLSDNRARWYEPATGTFINEDPSGFKGGDANLFRYVGNDPLNQVDPSGLAAKWASYAGGVSTSATMGSAVSPLGWSVLGQQGPLAPTAASPSVSAMAYASLVRQPPQAAAAAASMFSMAPPAVVVSTSGGTVYSPVATSRPAAVPSTPYSSLQTTVSNSRGMVYTPASVQALAQSGPVESPRWTTLDRITKYASANAYRMKDGGLLSQFVPEYDPSGKTGRYSQAGFSATLTRASDHDPAGSPNIYILAYRGTNGFLAFRDWLANAQQVANFETKQFTLGIELAKAVQANLPPGSSLIGTGHSKAGAQALAVAHALRIPVIVHNPFSLSPLYQKGTPGSIRTHITLGDPLSVLRTIQNGLELFDPPSLQHFRSAQGEIFVHPPRWFNTHSLDSLPR